MHMSRSMYKSMHMSRSMSRSMYKSMHMSRSMYKSMHMSRSMYKSMHMSRSMHIYSYFDSCSHADASMSQFPNLYMTSRCIYTALDFWLPFTLHNRWRFMSHFHLLLSWFSIPYIIGGDFGHVLVVFQAVTNLALKLDLSQRQEKTKRNKEGTQETGDLSRFLAGIRPVLASITIHPLPRLVYTGGAFFGSRCRCIHIALSGFP